MPHRRIAAVLVAAGLALLPTTVAQAAATKLAGSPLSVFVGDLGQLQAQRADATAKIFFAPQDELGDAGFFLAFPTGAGAAPPPGLAGHVYGFDGSAGPDGLAPYTGVSQGAVTGSGSAGDPLRQVTSYAVVDAGAQKVLVTQTTTYVNGSQEFTVRWELQNKSAGPLAYKALAAADFYFEGSDVGTGIFTQGPPRFVGGTNADTGTSGGFLERPGPSPPWSHYQALPFGGAPTEVWGKVQGAGASTAPAFDDTVVGEPVDNAGGVEWDQALTTPLAAGATAAYELVVRSAVPSTLQLTPSNAGAPQGTPVTVTATAVDTAGTPFNGRTLRWQITGANALSGSTALDAAGQGTITDPGANAGPDTIVAYVDLNNNGTREAVEPQASSLATFVDNVPPSCSVKVTGDRPGATGGGAGKPLVITVTCGETATVITDTTLVITPPTAKKATAAATKPPKKGKKKHKPAKPKPVTVKLPPMTAAVAPGQALPLSIAIPKAIAKKYAGAKVTATVTVTATDGAGNRATATASKTTTLAKPKPKAKKKSKKKPAPRRR